MPKKVFWILKIEVFRNDNFHAGQEVKENYVGLLYLSII